MDGIGLLPVVGAVKYVDEAGALVKNAVKSTDEAGDLIKDSAKLADDAAGLSGKVDNAVDDLARAEKAAEKTEDSKALVCLEKTEKKRYHRADEIEGPNATIEEKVTKKKPSITWDQKTQCWRDTKTGMRTKGPKMPKGFGKPSTWKEGTKNAAGEMIASKEGRIVYEKMRDSSIQDDFIGAFEQTLKQIIKNNNKKGLESYGYF